MNHNIILLSDPKLARVSDGDSKPTFKKKTKVWQGFKIFGGGGGGGGVSTHSHTLGLICQSLSARLR